MDQRALERQQREAEIAQIVASFSQPAAALLAHSAPAAASSAKASSSSSSGGSGSDSDSASDDDDLLDLPLASSFAVKGHQKPVTSVGLDKSGMRLATGSLDGIVCLWDFATGASHETPKPLRTLAGSGDADSRAGLQAVVSSVFSASGKLLAVTRADPQLAIFDREGGGGKAQGEPKIRTTRGDQYLVDLAKTKGHTGACTGSAWSQVREAHLVTSSVDGSLRVWDVEGGPRALMGTELGCTYVLKTKSERPGRNAALACAVSRQDRIAAACADGTVQFWSLKDSGSYVARPDTTVGGRFSPAGQEQQQHGGGGNVASVDFSEDGLKLALAQGSHVWVWDTRKLQTALWDVALPGAKGVSFGPDAHTLAATCREGVVGFNARLGGEPLRRRLGLVAPPSSNLVWNHAANQLAVGCGDGAALVLYDVGTSRRGGALLAMESRERAASARPPAKPSRPTEMYARVDHEAIAKAEMGTVMSLEEANRLAHQPHAKSRKAVEREKQKRIKQGPITTSTTGLAD